MSNEKSTHSETGQYASPPCFMHELGPDYGVDAPGGDGWTDVLRWRRAERKRLIDERLGVDAEERKVLSTRIATGLDRVVGKSGSRIVSAYWPFRGEPDLRDWMIRMHGRGARIALPVVIKNGWPLEFRIWAPGDPLVRGVWNILVPAHGPAVQPDVVVAPVVGFDEANYRLGYGGGFFDRTLAAMPRRPLVVGVGYVAGKIRTIYPQDHDIPMDVIVTDE
ncbi:5-formyltetrahydrofolate cyclo-ligase [Pseudaminobacter sp. NGMCC 1.201702]|uniref:5-formyltetrahydrofolate cyclo-ligase n=1 Tax=Pseudaminobacter sp. NGMCC 1.201702 TaxID=3391825 RepID=UPI0039F0CC6D